MQSVCVFACEKTDNAIHRYYIFYYLVCRMAYTCIKYLKETFFLKNIEKISWIDFRSTVIKGPFRIGARALYNTLWSKCFTGSFARALAFAAQCLIFACVSMVTSSLLKIAGMHTVMMWLNAIQVIAMQYMNISTNILQCFV